MMEENVAPFTVSNKAEATLGAKALNSALHFSPSFPTSAMSPYVHRSHIMGHRADPGGVAAA
jgi:hypothetical protein